MGRPCTLFTGQWADLPFETVCQKAKSFGYDGIELPCWGDHFSVREALENDRYCQGRWEILQRHGLEAYAISAHLVGQAVCDRIDARHQSIVPEHVWGDGQPNGVNQRAARELADTARACKRLFDCAPADVKSQCKRLVVNGFTGSPIWHLLYSFPPNLPSQIEDGYKLFADRFHPILDVFDQEGVVFGLEVHPTEIAFDIATAERAVAALGNRKTFGFNYDPSHFGYQGVDYVEFIRRFRDRIYHVHMKDVYWSEERCVSGVFAGHLDFGDARRFWDFRSLGRGRIDFEEVIRALNEIRYEGPLSVEWEDSGMDREHGAAEACAFVKRVDFPPSAIAFDAQFER